MLGCPRHPVKAQLRVVWLLQEDHELGGEEGRAEFTLLLGRPASSGSSGGAAALAQQLQQQAL